ncbi:MAG TPA: hypothetical protein VKZ50_00820 [bacterium]|nr:hypothetical protein [bacterium]
MSALRDTSPDFVYSLHNAGFGGVYYYPSRRLDAAYALLHQIPHELGLVLSLGEPEMPWAVEWAPAVYRIPSVRDAYDYHAQYASGNPVEHIAGGGSSWDYLTSFRAPDRLPTVLITELPYFQSPDISDQTPTTETKGAVILSGVERTRDMLDALSGLLAEVSGEVVQGTRLMRAFSSFVAYQSKSIESKRTWAKEAPGMSQPATVAQRADEFYVKTYYKVLMASMLNRALAAHLQTQRAPAVIDAQQRLERWLTTWLSDVESHLCYTAIPTRTLVQAQYGAMLAVMGHIDAFEFRSDG